MGWRLVLGGARSGKSSYAMRAADAYAETHNRSKVFIATAEARDEEMAARIARHRADRGADWRLVEAPLRLADAISALSDDDVALIDCLTLWLSNSMLADDGGHSQRLAALDAALKARRGAAWVVSNEVGWGIVPDNALARRYRDEAGQLHQSIAATAETVVLVVAGLPLFLKTPHNQP